MNIIYTILIGFIVGLIARAVMPGKDSYGIILTTLLGITGALIGSWIGQNVGWAQQGEGAGFFASLMGALLVLFVLSFFKNRNALAN